MDYSGDWGVTFDNNEDEDWISIDWYSNSVTLVRGAIEKYAPKIDGFDVLPSFGEIDLEQSMNQSEAEWIEKSLPNPSDCLEIFKKYSILSKAQAEEHRAYSKLLWLFEKWSEGFSIFISY